MINYVNIFRIFVSRLGASLLTLIGITVLSFVLGHLAPGDPIYAMLSQDDSDILTEQEIQSAKKELGLDKSIPVQYYNWISNVVKGNIGKSYMTDRDIYDELKERLAITLKLSALAIFFLIFCSVPLGFLLAIKKDTWFDKIFLFISSIFSAIPSFLIAIFFIIIFAQELKIFATSGYSGLKSLILPAITISLSSIMMISRILRSELLATFGENYFLMSRSKGFTYSFSAFKHSLPNALATVIALWSNYFLAILGGSTIAENIFALPGLGQWILKSINSHDYPAIQGYILIMGVLCIAIFMITDLLLLLVQPKLRKSL